MKKVKVKDAVDMVLAHDMTKIVPGEYKGPAFKKGQKITEDDIPELLKMGKEHIYIHDLGEDELHEDDGAARLAKLLKGSNLTLKGPSEGKLSLISECSGLLKIDIEGLFTLNYYPEMVASTLHNNRPVKKGQVVAETRVIPLVIEEHKIVEVESKLRNNSAIVNIKPFQKKSAGLIVTGNEVYYGRITDKFKPVIEKKLADYKSSLVDASYLPDDKEQITKKVSELISCEDIDLVILSGGMSVDPDDITPDAIRETGAEIETYGTPVLPGAMVMLAYLKGKPILGLPACVMFAVTTAFDLFLPRVLAGEMIFREEIAKLGHGGLCRSCDRCSYPNCGFGKGS